MTFDVWPTRPRWRAAVTAAVSAVALHAPCAFAQVRDTALGAQSIAKRSFRPPFHDTLVVPLAKHGLYRVAVWPGRTVVRIERLAKGATPGFAPRVREGTGDSTTVIEFDALDDGPHVIAVDPPRGTDEVRLWVWEDVDAEAAAQHRREARLTLGGSMAAGVTSGYSIGELTPATASKYLEGGLLVGSYSRFSLFFGIGNDARSSGVESVNWAFAEPRFRLFSWSVGGRDLDVQVAVRYAQGNSTNIIEDPSLVASGLLLNWHLDHRHRTHGWTVGVAASYGRLGNVDAANQRVTRVAWSLSWLP